MLNLLRSSVFFCAAQHVQADVLLKTKLAVAIPMQSINSIIGNFNNLLHPASTQTTQPDNYNVRLI